MTEGHISNSRVKNVSVVLNEIVLNVHGEFVNSFLALQSSLFSLLSDDVITPFLNSDVMTNWNHM